LCKEFRMPAISNVAACLRPMLESGDVHIFRVRPTAISVLDDSKGFAHTDLVTC
jgi:hypothetical protein